MMFFVGQVWFFTNVYNPRSAVVRKEEYLKTTVKKGSTIGANATIICGVTLGENCFIAAGAVVNKDVKEFALMAGVPARQIGWMSKFGEQINLPTTGSGEWICPNTKYKYVLNDGSITIC